MTETFSLHGRHVSARAVRVVLVLILSLPGGTAWTQDRAEVTETPAPTAPALPPAPNRQPGLLEALGRWVDDSVSGVGKGFEKAWRGTATQRDEAAKASTEATSNLAKGAVDAAKGTADALGKLGTSRVVSGRERCAIGANGAPDCRPAVEALCKAKGYNSGSSVDFETTERCPAQVLLSGRRTPGDCPVDHVVTKAMCQ
jgi:hypothetical protein